MPDRFRHPASADHDGSRLEHDEPRHQAGVTGHLDKEHDRHGPPGAVTGGTKGERFVVGLARALGGPPPSLIGLAVSGGPDSMAMLALAAAALPGRVVAATVDHGLRPASRHDAELVEERCASLDVPHATLHPPAPIAGVSLQARAREARYALLARWAMETGAGCLVTAHHADDQAETFLMRAARGSGVAGLAGIRRGVILDGVAVVRPLLDWRRDELRAVAERAGRFVDDPANADPRHDRTRFRRLLAEQDWLDAGALARSAALVGEVEADLTATIDWLWATCRRDAPVTTVTMDVATLPRELRRRLARRAIGAVRAEAAIARPAWSHAAGIEPLLDALEQGRAATQAGVLALVDHGLWRFRPAPPRRMG